MKEWNKENGMNTKNISSIVCISVSILLLLLLTAFAGVDTWEQEKNEDSAAGAAVETVETEKDGKVLIKETMQSVARIIVGKESGAKSVASKTAEAADAGTEAAEPENMQAVQTGVMAIFKRIEAGIPEDSLPAEENGTELAQNSDEEPGGGAKAGEGTTPEEAAMFGAEEVPVPGGETTPGEAAMPSAETVQGETTVPGAETTPEEVTTPGAETASEETVPGAETTPGETTAPGAEMTPEEATMPGAETTSEEAAAPDTASVQTETDYFEGQFMVTVTGKTALNVRKEPSADSAWVGKMYEGDGGTILEEGDGWTKIHSGKVTGWVSNDYIVMGDAGREKALEDSELVIEVESDALKVRSAPTTEEENKLRAIYGGETYPMVSVQGDWVEIEYSEGKNGWVSAEYVTIRYNYGDAMSRKEIEEAERARKRVNVATTTRASRDASYDDTTLLACLIQCESGSYEGQLAVANVILNRVNSSKYPNSISDVIYAAGQFTPASSGSLAKRLQKGPSSTALQAAEDALSGVNNIGNFLHFRSAKSADIDSYSSYTIVAGNCFYTR